MPTKLMGVMTISSIIKICIIYIIMLIARTLRFSKLLLVRSSGFQVSAPNLPLLQYERFFKQVQKANHPQEAINIYASYVENKEGSYPKYLTNTLRILTRLIRKLDQKQIDIIDTFFQGILNNINALDVSKLESDDLKDVVLFFYKYSQHVSSLNLEQQHILARFLTEFVARFQRAKDAGKLLLAPILFTNIRLSSLYCPSLEKQIITHSINLLYSHQEKLIANTLTFVNLLSTLRQIYDPTKPFLQQLVHSTFFLLSMKEINKLFDSYGKATILHTIIDIRQMRGANSVVSTSLLLQEVQKSVEEMLVKEMLECNQRTLEFLISGLLKLKADSIILKEYFKIIENSIDANGMAKLNPNIIIWAVGLLDRTSMPQLLSRAWQQRFVQMLKVYYHKNNHFVYPISSQLLMLIQKELFDAQINLQLYYFFNNQYHFHKKEYFIKTLHMYIKQAEVHAFFKNHKEVTALLGVIEKMLHLLTQTWPGDYGDYFWSFQDLQAKISSAKGVEYPQIRPVEFDRRLRVGSVDKNSYYKQLKAYLLCLELTISEHFNIPEIISKLVVRLSNSRSSDQQLLLFLNYILFRTKLSDANYGILQAGLEDIFNKNKLNLRQSIYRMVMEEIFQQDLCETNIRLKKEISHLEFKQYKGKLLCYQSLKQHIEKIKHPVYSQC